MTGRVNLKEFYKSVFICTLCKLEFGSDFPTTRKICTICIQKGMKKKQVEIRRRYKKLSLLNGGKSI